ncbi:LacI family transcriptional regulator [Christensenellaceae bacterium OttesenSCG-928-L17]|nr:LacI family transcriptional regulator [Christensenellaceae bacterium OttesenSCG-928-L17]
MAKAKKNKATSTDVARLAGVSQSTVSMVLNNNHQSFSPETVARVFSACDELNYRLPRSNKAGLSDNSKALLAICPSFVNLHYVTLVESMQIRAQELGYSLLTYCTYRNAAAEAGIANMVNRFPVAGALFLYQPASTHVLQEVSNFVPAVSMYDKIDETDVDLIEQNSMRLGSIIATHLLELGHRNIAYISTPFGDNQLARSRRYLGMCGVFEEAGENPDNIIPCTMETEGLTYSADTSEYDTGYQLARHVVERYPVTAMVGFNDMVALGIMDALLDLKKRIPQDYSVCGCDNTMFSRCKHVSMTSIETYNNRRGREAVDLLVRKVTQELEPQSIETPVSTVRVEYAPRLIHRASSGVNKRLLK